MLYSTLFLALVSASFSAAAPSSHEHTHSARAHTTSAKRDAQQHSLMMQVKAQDDMNDPDDLTVAATIINTGTKPVKILNDPNSAFVMFAILGVIGLTIRYCLGALSTWKTHTFNFVSVPAVGPDGVKSKTDGVSADVDSVRVKVGHMSRSGSNFAPPTNGSELSTTLSSQRLSTTPARTPFSSLARTKPLFTTVSIFRFQVGISAWGLTYRAASPDSSVGDVQFLLDRLICCETHVDG